MKNRIVFTVVAVLSIALVHVGPAFAGPVTFSYVTIDFPGAAQSGASGINNAGDIVGGYALADGSRHGFLYSAGMFTTIDDPNATSGTEATGINNMGQIVGTYDLLPVVGHGLEGAHAFLYNAGSYTTLDYPAPGVTSTTAHKINDSGNIVGVYRMSGLENGFLYVGGVFSTVNVPTTLGCCTHMRGINNAGHMVGQYSVSGTDHGFLDMGGTFTTIDFPSAAWTVAEDINSSGDILGTYGSVAGQFLGFLDTSGTFQTIAFPGATSTEAVGINDQGDIVGFYEDSSGVLHGFEVMPTTSTIPEPGTLGLLGMGLLAAVRTYRRRRT